MDQQKCEKKILVSRSTHFLPSFRVRLFLRLSSLLPCSSASTQKSRCAVSLQHLFPGCCISSPALRFRHRSGAAERTLTQGIRGKKHSLRMDEGRKSGLEATEEQGKALPRMLKLLLRFEVCCITYPWGSTSRSERTASAKALQWRRGA